MDAQVRTAYNITDQVCNRMFSCTFFFLFNFSRNFENKKMFVRIFIFVKAVKIMFGKKNL